MKLQTKIVSVSFGISLPIGVFAGMPNYSNPTSDLFLIMGIVGFFAGVTQFITGLFFID